jgi:transposase-like protein
MLKNFSSLIEFQKEFSTESKCVKHLISLRWGKKPFCVHCGSVDKIYKLKKPELFECGVCHKQFSVRVGTIFEDSKLPLMKWFLAFYLEVNHKKGISSVQLGKDLGVRQATAWFMQQRIRYALKYNTIEKMTNNVEVDETYIGGKETNKHTNNKNPNSQGGNNKMTVIGMIERGGKLALEYINKTNIKTVKPILEQYIDIEQAQLYSDTSPLYKSFKNRKTINHSIGEYGINDIYTNTIEGAFSQFKRYLNGTHHQVSDKHLSKYINVFTFRFNNRTKSEVSLFNSALISMFGKRLQYSELVS